MTERTEGVNPWPPRVCALDVTTIGNRIRIRTYQETGSRRATAHLDPDEAERIGAQLIRAAAKARLHTTYDAANPADDDPIGDELTALGID
jgi:hypothetical protein